MIRFFKNLFKARDPGPEPELPYKVETPPAKVEAVVAQPVVEAAPAKEPAKKRTFTKREDSGGPAKVAKIKAPAKTKAPVAPRAPKAK